MLGVFSQQGAHNVISKRKSVLHENRLSSHLGHNLLEDVELTYKGDPAPKEPNRIYDSSDKLNVVIKGWFVHKVAKKYTCRVHPN